MPFTQSVALRFNNVAIAVGDLVAMVAWYERVLGLRVAERGRFDAVGADYAMLDGPDFRVELISRGTPSARVDRTGPPGHLDVLGYTLAACVGMSRPGWVLPRPRGDAGGSRAGLPKPPDFPVFLTRLAETAFYPRASVAYPQVFGPV